MAGETPGRGSRPIGRPRVGVKVDFRIPEEVRDSIEHEADSLGVAHDAHYRDILVAGWNARNMAGARA